MLIFNLEESNKANPLEREEEDTASVQRQIEGFVEVKVKKSIRLKVIFNTAKEAKQVLINVRKIENKQIRLREDQTWKQRESFNNIEKNLEERK